MAKSQPSTVKELVEEIKTNLTQTSSSAKDELRVAQTMLNDPTYVVDVYDKNGVAEQYCPYTETRKMVTSILKSADVAEPETVAEEFKFSKEDAEVMVDFGKEFVNTFLQTGRKLPLGSRARSNCALVLKTKPAHTNSFPVPKAVDDNGERVYAQSSKTTPEYDTIKVSGSCPVWLKNQ